MGRGRVLRGMKRRKAGRGREWLLSYPEPDFGRRDLFDLYVDSFDAHLPLVCGEVEVAAVHHVNEISSPQPEGKGLIVRHAAVADSPSEEPQRSAVSDR